MQLPFRFAAITAATVTGFLAASVVAMASPATAPTAASSRGPVAANGETVGGNPVLHRNELRRVAVAGFAPGTPVEVRLVGGPPLTDGRAGTDGTAGTEAIKADADGVASVAVQVPTDLVPGSYRICISGRGQATRPAGPGGRSAPGVAVVVEVPRLAFFAFRLAA